MEPHVAPEVGDDRVAAILLAAGFASRMGKSKLTLPFGGSTVIGSTLAAVRNSSVDDVVVVVGHHGDLVRDAVGPGVTVVENSDPSMGNASSLAVGISGVKAAGAVVIVPADQPTVPVAAIEQIVQAWRGGACVAAIVDYDDGPGHPLLIDRSMFDVVGALHGAKTLWQVVEGLDPEIVRRVRCNQPRPIDINREADYRLALQQLG